MGYEVDFLPVGDGERSGDAIALRFGDLLADPPTQTVVVIDGGTKESGEALVAHIKKLYGTSHVDIVVSTHPDSDHSSGLTEVLENLSVGQLWMHLPWKHTDDISKMFVNDRVIDRSVREALRKSLDNARDLERLAESKSIPIFEPFAGATDRSKQLVVIGPSRAFYESLLPGFRGTPEPVDKSLLARGFEAVKEAVKRVAETFGIETLDDEGKTSAENNSSVVLLLTADEHHLLFTADAGIPALTQVVDLLERVGLDPKAFRFVQVPHHGSKRNVGPTLLNRLVGPKLSQPASTKTAYVSVSTGGLPKHPAKKVTNAFLRRGAPVHATAGLAKCHRNDAPGRGWGASASLPFYSEVDE